MLENQGQLARLYSELREEKGRCRLAGESVGCVPKLAAPPAPASAAVLSSARPDPETSASDKEEEDEA
eukprot:12913652-Prorocentrum_lima.AAC.1